MHLWVAQSRKCKCKHVFTREQLLQWKLIRLLLLLLFLKWFYPTSWWILSKDTDLLKRNLKKKGKSAYYLYYIHIYIQGGQQTLLHYENQIISVSYQTHIRSLSRIYDSKYRTWIKNFLTGLKKHRKFVFKINARYNLIQIGWDLHMEHWNILTCYLCIRFQRTPCT